MATTCAITIGLRLSQKTIELIGLALAVTVVIAIIGLFCLFGAVGWQGFRWLRIWVNKAEFKARVISTEHGTWFIAHPKIDIAPLHNTPYLRINGHERELTPDERFYSTLQAPQNRANGATALLPAPQPEQQLDLLPLLDNAERVLVKGASDAGKTTLLQHIASRSQGVVILDPHNKPGQWPDGTRIIGNSYNFAEVNSFLNWFKTEIEKRYKQRAANDESYLPLTIIIDEFMTIREECEETRQVLSKAIRECRKIKIRLFIGSHSELVKPLGLEGAGDVRDGLLIIRLDIDQLTRQRSATVDYGRGERACCFPPFGGSILQVVPDLVLSPSVHTRETKIITLIQAGATDKEIAQEIFGKSYLSGDNFYKVKTLREQYS